MLVFFILVNLISNAIENELGILLDRRFNFESKRNISMDNCTKFNKDSFYYRGRPENIKNIIHSNKINDLNKYEVVYIPELKYFQNVTLFPKSTIFLYHLYRDRFTYNQSYKDYCLIDINYSIESYNYYYIVIGKTFGKDKEELIIETFIILYTFIFILFIIILIKTGMIKKILQVSVYQFSFNIIFMLTFYNMISIIPFLLSYLLYCFYKAFIFIYLFLFVNRFKILDNNSCIDKYFIFFFYLIH